MESWWIVKFGTFFCAVALVTSTSLVTMTSNSSASTERSSISYLFNGDASTWTQLVSQAKGSLNEVDPNFFVVDASGNLQMNSTYQSDFVTSMHQQGVKVIPFLAVSNADIGAKALENRSVLAQEVVSAVQQDGFDGVNIDIEGLDQTYRNSYTDFVQKIKTQIGQGKVVSVAVTANPNGLQTGTNTQYDYHALAENSDFLTIMAYDDHYLNDPNEGPVASLPFVKQSIEYALKQGVASSKIVLGIPFYGRLWKIDSPQPTDGSGIVGTPISMFRDQEIISHFPTKPTYDRTLGTNKLTFTIPKGQNYPIPNTQTVLESGTYDLFFEDENSVQAKLDLVKQYNLRGVASWSLYQASQDTWTYFQAALNSDSFSDVPVGYWARDAIQTMSYKNWMNGTGVHQFGPTNSLTRIQAVTILVRALGLGDVTPDSFVFTDIPTGDAWGKQAVEVAREYGIVHGITATTFAPDSPLTREQLAVMLQNVFNLKVSDLNNNPFKDVDPKAWSYQAIVAMKENNIISGAGDGTFHPHDTSLREQMATLMYKLIPQIQAKQGTLQPVTK